MEHSAQHAWTLNADLVYLFMVIFALYLVQGWRKKKEENDKIEDGEDVRLPPGTMGVPFLGETPKYIMQKDFFKQKLKEYGSIYKTHLFGKPTIVVSGPQNVRKVLMNEHTLVAGLWPKSVRIILGKGSLSQSDGDIHRFRRKVVLRAFSHEALASYTPTVQKIIRQNVASWCEQPTIKVYKACKELMFHVASVTMLGYTKASQKDIDHLANSFADLCDNIFTMVWPIQIPGTGIAKALNARKVLVDKIDDIFDENQNAEELEFVPAYNLIRDGQELNREELQDVATELLFAGHDTTATTVTAFIQLLSKHPDVIVKLRKELNDFGLMDESVTISYSMLRNLVYVDCVMKEVMRFQPTIGGGFRKVLHSFELEGYTIPKDWSVIYSIRDTHATATPLDESNFNPDRWLQHTEEKGNIDDRFSFIPFGLGARGCVGKEFAKLVLKLFLVEVLRMTTWNVFNPDTEIKFNPMPHPKDGLPAQFTRINKQEATK